MPIGIGVCRFKEYFIVQALLIFRSVLAFSVRIRYQLSKPSSLGDYPLSSVRDGYPSFLQVVIAFGSLRIHLTAAAVPGRVTPCSGKSAVSRLRR
jgi:hypothetical protein